MSKAAELCQKAIQNELQNPSWEPPRHPLGHPCEHNLQFVQICSILGVPSCPQSSQTEPRWVPKSNKIKQKLIPETSSEKATRHAVFKDAFQAEFTQSLEDPTSRKQCYLLHRSHLALQNTAICCAGATWRSKWLLGHAFEATWRSKWLLRHALEATWRSKWLLGHAFEATGRSKALLRHAFEATWRSKLQCKLTGLGITVHSCTAQLFHFSPCMDMHGITLVYIYIYIYTYYIHIYIYII